MSKVYAIKAEIRKPHLETFEFKAQKTMYGGKHIAAGDTVFLFASRERRRRGSGCLWCRDLCIAHRTYCRSRRTNAAT